jgi:hypothetical protein
MRLHWRREPQTRGQALVEFALAVPIFLMLIFGLIDLGRAVYVNNAIAQAARDAARWASVQERSQDEEAVSDYAVGRLTAVPNPEVSVSCEKIEYFAIPECTTHDVIIVELRSRVDMITPIIGQIVGPLDLSAESRMVVNR